MSPDDKSAGHGPTRSASARDSLYREGFMFDFYQAVRSLEEMFPDGVPPGEGTDPAEERIRFRPHTGLAFPATDIKRVTPPAEGRSYAEVTATFMGLYGVDSPLPGDFTSDITTEAEETLPHRDFLDIFNHRLYSFFYRAWKKYRPDVAYDKGKDAYSLRAKCFAGLGNPHALNSAPVPPLRLAAFGGLIGHRVRNAHGLRNLLAGILDAVHVDIVENVPRWWRVPERPAMGRTARTPALLGITSVVGEKVYDISGKFRIVLGPLTLEQYRSFLPGGKGARVVDALVRLYAPDNLDFDVELVFRTHEIPVLRLDGKTQLGLTTWSGRPAGEMVSRIVSYEHMPA